jgi:flagellar M-ring protein FliF
VVDMRGNLLNKARQALSPDDPEPSEAAIDYRQKIERDLLAKIDTTLEPLLGADKFRATASVECDFTSAEQSDESYDPSKSVMVTSQKTEDISGGTTATTGVPGTASNLPRPTSRPGGGANGVTRRSENITYQSSHSVRHMRLPQGTVKKMSIALLVDSDVRTEGAGAKAKRIIEPPSADKLKVIHDLVAGVIGFSAERGDQLIVETMPFEATLNPEPISPVVKPAPPAPPPWYEQALKNKFVLIGAGVAAAILLTLLVLMFRLLRRSPMESAEMAPQLAAATGETLNSRIENQLAEQAATRQKQEMDALNALKLPPVTKKAEVLTKHIGEQAKKDSSSMAHVLRSWMSEGKT